VWLALGMLIYFGYGKKNSKLRLAQEATASNSK
jgi:APA family basic amino acid/polyamine antiporter